MTKPLLDRWKAIALRGRPCPLFAEIPPASSCVGHHPRCAGSPFPRVWGPSGLVSPGGAGPVPALPGARASSCDPSRALLCPGPSPGTLRCIRHRCHYRRHPCHPTVPEADVPRDLGPHQGGIPVPAEPIPQVRAARACVPARHWALTRSWQAAVPRGTGRWQEAVGGSLHPWGRCARQRRGSWRRCRVRGKLVLAGLLLPKALGVVLVGGAQMAPGLCQSCRVAEPQSLCSPCCRAGLPPPPRRAGWSKG